MNKELSLAERRYLENEEFNKQNTDAVRPSKNKAAEFRKANGYSLTFAKLMKKWGCATPDEWRALRKKHQKEKYVGPKKEKPVVEKPAAKQDQYRGKKRY
jgi:hypothetical protein